MVDYGVPEKGIMAMMKTTGFPASAVAWMLASGAVRKKGAIPQELCIPGREFLGMLRPRGFVIDETHGSGGEGRE